MRKSREFNNILDECLERLLVKGETAEQCLRSFPEYADKLEPLLETALTVKKASAIQPRPEFRDKARYQFYSALQRMEPRKGYSLFGWQTRWVAVAVVLAFLLAGSGTVAAAGGSMPDEPLYQVKLATEQVRLAFTFSDLGKAQLHAKLADKRVTEIVYLADKNEPEKIDLTTDSLNNHLTKMADLASTQEVKSGVVMAPAVEEESAPDVAPAAGEAEEELAVEEAPAPEIAPAAKEALLAEKAPAVKKAPVTREAPVVKEAPALLERTRDGKKVRISVERRARLKATVVRQATNHTVRLRAALETVPQSARPALRRAIDVSEAGYEKVLESLD